MDKQGLTHSPRQFLRGGSEGNGGGVGSCRRAGCRDTEARAAVVSLHPSYLFLRLPVLAPTSEARAVADDINWCVERSCVCAVGAGFQT